MVETHITVGAHQDFETYLKENLDGGPAGDWPVKKSAQVGDRVVIFIGTLRAYGTVAGEPKSGEWRDDKNRYFVPVKKLKEIKPPISTEQLKEAFPDWGWPSYPRSYTSVPQEITQEFWNLINSPIARDIEAPPERVKAVVSRIVRDTAKAKALKVKYDYKCQLCDVTLPYGNEQNYIEVHHLRPLGKHDGPDTESNMLVLCPNHHALFDLAVPRFIDEQTVEVNGERFSLTLKHEIAREHKNYYRREVQSNLYNG